jgi:hypothetical protein
MLTNPDDNHTVSWLSSFFRDNDNNIDDDVDAHDNHFVSWPTPSYMDYFDTTPRHTDNNNDDIIDDSNRAQQNDEPSSPYALIDRANNFFQTRY